MIAVVGGKGGCGRTTTALGLGIVLGKMGVPTRIIDYDWGMPTLHVQAETDRTPTINALTGSNDADLFHRTRWKGVTIGTAPRTGAQLEHEQGLKALPNDQPTIIDTPAGTGTAVTAVLRAADRAVLVCGGSGPGMEDTWKTARMAQALETPLLGTVVVDARSLSNRPEQQFPTDRVYPVPTVPDRPLDKREVLRAYRQLIEERINLTPPASTKTSC